jgi:lipoprotein-anchoring transpeptidase ErfK/SrfK
MGEEESDITEQLRKPPEVPPVTPTTEKIQPPLFKNKLAKRRILIIILMVFVLLTARRITPAHSSYAPSLENLQVTPSLTPTATATATSTNKPTATKTTAPSSTPETMIKVSGYTVNLRAGPDINFTVVRRLIFGELLMLLGRSSDNTWLYVKTSDGQEGWIKTTWVDLAGVNVDYHPITTPSPPPEKTVKVSGNTVNLRTGPGTYFLQVRRLTFGELLILLGRLRDNTWLYVKTLDGQKGWIKTTWVDLTGVNLDYDFLPVEKLPPTETSTPVVLVGIKGHWIDIDLSEQMLYAYDGIDLVASFLVSTGIDLYPTETGKYRIYVKMRYSDMHGNDYYLPDVPYTMYYSGDFSIHGTYWHHSFGTPMSHGCVNMDTSDAEWLYNWSYVGTLVNIHR